MFVSNRVAELFPTHLWVHQLAPEFHEPIDARIESELETLFAEQLAGPRRKVLQTGHDFHCCEAMQPLVPCFEEAVAAVLGFLKTKAERFAITGCWANLTGAGVPHILHCHPNNFVAGVYYAKVPAGADIIKFDDPRPHWKHVAPERSEFTAANANTIEFTVKQGMLIIFPAWLMHEVPAHHSSEHRISVSFNAMFADFAETISPPQWRSVLDTTE